MGDLTTMQYFFKMMDAKGYIYWYQLDSDIKQMTHVFFANPRSLNLLRRFPNVIVFDATFKTNQYNMPLLEIMGATPTGKNFHIAFCFMKDRSTESFVWALTRLQYLFGSYITPGLFMTCREIALMTALEVVFPHVPHMLCRGHIAMDVKRYATKLLGTTVHNEVIKKRWKTMVESHSEAEYLTNLETMEIRWMKYLSALLVYVKREWLDSYRQKFVGVWTKDILHFGAETTNRVESVHSELRRCLSTNTEGFHTLFPKIHTLVEHEMEEIHGTLEQSRTVHHYVTSYVLCSKLGGNVAHRAIEMICKEFKRGGIVGTRANICGCVLRLSYGLPCCHEMFLLMEENRPVDPADIHPFWRTLDTE